MFKPTLFSRFISPILLVSASVAVTLGQDQRSDFDQDGYPDLVWRNRATGKCQIWYLTNTVTNGLRPRQDKPPKDIVDGNGFIVANPAPAGTNPDNWWRIVGTGRVNSDSNPDIIWQHMGDGRTAVWFMDGADGNRYNYSTIAPQEAPGWRLIDVADFNGNGSLDILWENVSEGSFPVGTKAFWYMNSSWQFLSSSVPSQAQLPPTPTGWQTVRVGDFGRVINGVAEADGIPDGKSDLLLRNMTTGSAAIWIMKGLNGNEYSGGYNITDTQGTILSAILQLRLVGDHDYGGPTDGLNTRFTDILWRRKDFGDAAVWYLKGKYFQSSAWVGPIDQNQVSRWQEPFGNPQFNTSLDAIWRTWYDHQEKLAGEELPNPIDRISGITNQEMRAVVTAGNYVLTWNMPPPSNVTNNYTYKIYYKKAEDTAWNYITALVQNATTYNGTYTGTSLGGIPIDVGQRYDFNVTSIMYTSGLLIGDVKVAQTTAAASARPIENRGAILLLVDSSLNSAFTTRMSKIVNDLTKWLKGDGWQVFVNYAPRHVDDYSQSGFVVNYNQLPSIKTTIGNYYTNNNVRMLFIIGHVVIPYSGYISFDGHGSRAGPADIYYADLDGHWTDVDNAISTIPTTSSGFPLEEWQYGAGDGKMDQSRLPRTSSVVYNGLELGVGRVDFARMPGMPGGMQTGNAPSTNEITLLEQYFEKTRKFRFSEAPYPLPAQAVAWGEDAANNPLTVRHIVGKFRSLINYLPESVVSGNSLMQVSAPYLLGYLGGRAETFFGYSAYGVDGNPRPWHRPSDVSISTRVPKIGIHVTFSSFSWDWNLENGIRKALLSSPDYGLVSLFGQRYHRFEGVALGESFGQSLIKQYQAVIPFREDITVDFNMRTTQEIDNEADPTFCSILGDPTLRLHYPKAPLTVNAPSNSTLSWTASTEPGTLKYLVYRRNPSTQVYGRVSACTNGAVSGTSVALLASEIQAGDSYMVRTLKSITTGVGTYDALSQGAFYPAQ